MSRIDLSVVATGNFTQLQSQLAKIKEQISDINKRTSSASMVNPTALSNMQKYSSVMADQLRMTGMFETKLVSLTSETEKFGQGLVKGNIKLGDSFRTSMGYLKGQQTEIQKLARQQVRLQNSMTMAVGDSQAMVITPRGLDETIHKMQIANQEFRIFRQVLSNGSTQLINWGKNTQWAGRQLTVGLTVPLTIFGATASKVFMDADRQLTRLVKVYGDASKGIVQPAELESIRKETLGLATDIAKNMGVAVEETLGIAADIAATGKEGNELLAATSEAMRLSVLGEVDRQEAMRATISIQNVFKKDTAGLAESINFLNAVENQTSTSLDDLTTGIVKAGPVVQGLGGDIEDLSLMMVAMREGGITAAEAANAIKSSLASLINPTKQTQDLMNGFGIDLIGIVDKNAGDVIGTLTDLQSALSGLDELSRQRAIEQIFGKFQFSRINALLNNLNQAGSQTQQVLALAGMSAQELAQSAERELQAYTESATGRFTRALEGIKASLIPIGETFTNIGTMVLELGTKIVEIFNSLPDPVKNFLKGLGAVTAIAGPLIMIAGVFGNFIGYLLKGVSNLLALKSAGRGVFEYFTPESVAARESADLFAESLYDEESAVKTLATAIDQLSKALSEMGVSATQAGNSMSKMGAEVLSTAESASLSKSVFSGSVNEPRGSLLFHRMPKGQMTDEQRKYFSTASVFSKARDTQLNEALGETLVPALSGNAEMDQAAMQVVLDKLSRAGYTPTAEQRSRMFMPSAQIAREAASSVAYPSIFAQARQGGASDKSIRSMELQFRQDYLKDPQNAIKQLSAELKTFDVNLGKTVDGIAAELEKAYRQALDSGQSVEQATEAMFLKSIEIEEAARSQVDDVLSYTVHKDSTGKIVPRKSSAGAGQMMLQEGMSMLGETDVLSEEVVAAVEEELRLKKNASDIQEQINKNQLDQKKLSNEIKELQSKEKSRLKRIQQIQDKPVKDRTDVEKKELDKLRREQKKLQTSTTKLANAREEAANLEKVSEQNSKELVAATETKEQALKNSAVAEKREEISSTNAANADDEEARQSRNSAAADALEANSSIGASKKGLLGRIKGIGAGKLMAGAGVLSMATMLMPTGENEALGTATNVLGGAGMGASMGAMGGVPGMIAGALIGAAIPAITAYIDAQQKATDAMVRYGQAASGSALTIEQFGKELGRMSPSQRLAQAVSGLNIPKEMREQAQSILDSETGQSLIGLAKSLGGDERKTTLLRELQQLTLSEIFTPDEARAVAEGLAVELGDPMLGKALVSGITAVLDKDGNLIKDAISKQFIGSMPTPEEIAKLAPTTSTMYTGGGVESKVYTDSRETTVAKMSQIAGVLKNISDAEDLATLSLQSGEITREDYLSQLDEINSKRATAIQIAKDLMNTQESLVGKESVLGDIAAMQGITEEFDKVVDKTRELQGIIGTGDAFALQIESMAAYGQVSEGDIQNVINMINSDPNLKITVSDIFDVTGAEDYALDIIKMINQGMDANKIKVIVDAEGARDGIELINTYNTLVSSMPLETQLLLQAHIDYDPAAMQTLIQNVDYVNNLPSDPKELKVIVDGNPLLEEITDNWEKFISMSDEERKQAVIDAIYNIDINWGAAGLPANLIRPSSGSNAVDSATSSAISALGGVSTGGGGGGGSDNDTKAIEEAYDKQIEKQDKLIEGIQKEREERQKLYDLEKQAFDFAMREQDLKNQIARARAEGRTADAAMLQAQLDNARAEEKQKEAERRRQEQEDKQIEAANKRKEALEKDKKAALDAAKGGSGGGGGAEGISQETADAIKMAVMAVDAFTSSKSFKDMAEMMGPYNAFFNSKSVEKYRKEMQKLGVPLEVVDEILNNIYDDFIKSNEEYLNEDLYKKLNDDLRELGLSGEELEDMMPNVFGIMYDKAISSSTKIDLLAEAFEDVGFSADEARTKAEKLFETNTNIDLGNIDDAIDKYKALGDEAYIAAMKKAVLNIVSNNPNMKPEDAAAAYASAAGSDDSTRRRYEEGWASGGYITGPGTGTSDSIPTMLSNGEYVIRAASVARYGIPFLDAVNKGMLPGAARGGLMSRYPTAARGMRSGGYIYRAMGGEVKDGYSEYNINVSVAGTDASADDIANKVMQTLQRRDKMNRAGIRL